MMVDLQIGRFIDSFNRIASWHQVMLLQNVALPFTVPIRSFGDLKEGVDRLAAISGECEFAVIEVCAKQARDELARIAADGPNVTMQGEQLGRVIGSLGRLKDGVIAESQTRFAMILDSHSKQLWEPTRPPFGEDFKNKFSGSQYELDEAGKCLALARSTATVFHLMRLMETGLRAVHNCLGLSAPFTGNDRSWGNILKAIKEEIDRRPKGWAEKERFQALYASLDAVKDAWRNPTMHIENKYTPEEATHVFNMVRGFMIGLASRCDENGDPKA